MDSPVRIVGEVRKATGKNTQPTLAGAAKGQNIQSKEAMYIWVLKCSSGMSQKWLRTLRNFQGLVSIAQINHGKSAEFSHLWLIIQEGRVDVYEDELTEIPSSQLCLAGARVKRAYVEDWPMAFEVEKQNFGFILKFESPEEFNLWAKSISMEVLRCTKLEEVKTLEIMGETERNAAVKQYLKQQENWEKSICDYENKRELLQLNNDKTDEEEERYGEESCEFESFSFEEFELNRWHYMENPRAQISNIIFAAPKRLETIVEKGDKVNELREIFSSPPVLVSPKPNNNKSPNVCISPGPSNTVNVQQQEYKVLYEIRNDDRVKAWNGPYILQQEEREVLENINNMYLTRRKYVREELLLQAIKQVVADHEVKMRRIQETLGDLDEKRSKKCSLRSDYESLENQLKQEEVFLQEAQRAKKLQEALVQDLSVRFEMALSKGLQDMMEG
ncbi:uncharacterized protein LOC136041770 isoform X2 [Artemia franciscana]|uniref:uncharacterized protein LOC136041770 isoform X2 n=1 Tax=Artemia franciscana TaxID=6661 RepID=UPI0032D9B52F